MNFDRNYLLLFLVQVAQSDSSLLHDSHLLEDIRTCKRETAAIAVTLTETINMKANLEKVSVAKNEILAFQCMKPNNISVLVFCDSELVY